MKKSTRILISALCIVLALGAFFAIASEDDLPPRQLCKAANIYDILTPEVIEIYEKEIAGEAVLSKTSQRQIERISERFDMPIQKTKGLLLLQDFSARTGGSKSLNDFSTMNDLDLMLYCKSCVDEYVKTLTPERKAELEAIFKSILGI